MNVSAAWRRGFAVLGRLPWLALIPLLADLLTLGLGYLGVPLEPLPRTRHGTPESALPAVAFTMFLPSFLPSLSDLQVSLRPAGLPDPVGLPLVLTTLLGTLGKAVFYGLYLGLLASAVQGERLSVRGALARLRLSLPGLFLLFLAGRLGYLFLNWDWLLISVPVRWLLFALLPLVLGAGGLPLLPALSENVMSALGEAMSALWGRLGAWLGLAIRVGLANGVFMLVWSVFRSSGAPAAGLALAVYPFLATGLVAAAVALYLQPEAGEQPATEPGAWRWAWVAALAIPGALLGQVCWQSWQGWAPTREEALAPGYTYVAIVHSQPASGGGELVIYRDREQTGPGLLQQSRFGWKADFKEPWSSEKNSPEAALVRVTARGSFNQFKTSPQIVWGEIRDSRVAQVEVGGRRYPIGQNGPFFALELPPGTASFSLPGPDEVKVLDAAGQPVPRREGRR